MSLTKKELFEHYNKIANTKSFSKFIEWWKEYEKMGDDFILENSAFGYGDYFVFDYIEEFSPDTRYEINGYEYDFNELLDIGFEDFSEEFYSEKCYIDYGEPHCDFIRTDILNDFISHIENG